MNPFRRLWKQLGKMKNSSPPAWAGFFSPRQYHHFLALIQAHFQGENRAFTLGDGVVQVAQPGNGSQQLGLLNLAQNCAHNDESDWPDIIQTHFRIMAKSRDEHEVLEERLGDFERVAEFLMVRLWPDSYLRDIGPDKILHRRDVPGTITALVFDLPSSVRNVTPEEIKPWGKSAEELFDLGLANLRENCIPNVTEQDLGDGVTVTLFADESFFVASHALLLEDHEHCVGDFGALVGIPHRHVLLAYPIKNLSVVPALHRMAPIVIGMEREGPGSLSHRLYWYQKGHFTDLPFELKDRVLQFSPPEEFVEMMNLLGEPEDAE
jgi:hypothetical protein